MVSTGGRKTVLTMYGVSVALAGGFGFILGAVILPNAADVPTDVSAQVGPVTFPLSGPALAVYGMVSIGGLLGVGLIGVHLASRQVGTESTE